MRILMREKISLSGNYGRRSKRRRFDSAAPKLVAAEETVCHGVVLMFYHHMVQTLTTFVKHFLFTPEFYLAV